MDIQVFVLGLLSSWKVHTQVIYYWTNYYSSSFKTNFQYRFYLWNELTLNIFLLFVSKQSNWYKDVYELLSEFIKKIWFELKNVLKKKVYFKKFDWFIDCVFILLVLWMIFYCPFRSRIFSLYCIHTSISRFYASRLILWQIFMYNWRSPLNKYIVQLLTPLNVWIKKNNICWPLFFVMIV